MKKVDRVLFKILEETENQFFRNLEIPDKFLAKIAV